MEKLEAVPEDYLVVFADSIRILYQTIIWPIVIVGVVGNLAVVFRICFLEAGKNSTLKPFYRGALLSLAVSDLLLLSSSGANNLSFIGHRTILWELPEWTCNAIPYLQTVAVLVASLTLAGVAIDRYNAIKSKCPISNKGLKWPRAIVFHAAIWTLAAAASYPVIGIYDTEQLLVINSTNFYVGLVCTPHRERATTVFTALFAAIFVPLATVFIVVHVLLALSIWQRNFPGDNTIASASVTSQLSNDNSTASTSLGKGARAAAAVATVKRAATVPSYVVRKRRTVRVILLLIVVFAISRLPHWSFLLYKLHLTLSGNIYWHIQQILTTLSIFNSALNPFLYAFLNEALSLVGGFRGWCAKTAGKPATKKPTTTSEADEQPRTIAKVPRGPYQHHTP